ncbi:MAG: mechanosensitive ion channel [Methanobrevibacter sp.]|uniref:Mechanosensitive ion channel n=2 Tax=Methanobrevibacter millerae TaxID=230361 RepID=A0A8T3VL50_9EURY|nr:mechanosensitive ion channel [Methanobrevibacter millerae]MBR0058794.1 mechanosensitive ion channel [Methanobrevibacter sp.]MBR0370728.1 mechanosensitive ion channel [Methanobrevibacter sp.]
MNIPTNLVQTLLWIIVIIVLTTITSKIITQILNKFNRFKDDMTGIYLIRDIIVYIIYFIALMDILRLFGINLYGTLLSLGIVGIAVSLAAKDIISNLFSGIILIIGKSIKVGDTIEINKSKGVVEKIHLRTTTIVDDEGIVSNIPNSTLTNNLFKLYKAPEKYRINIMAGLPLNVDLDEFNSYILEKINKLDGVLDEPKPRIYAKDITFEQTNIKISFWIKDYNNKDDYKLIITNDVRKFTK